MSNSGRRGVAIVTAMGIESLGLSKALGVGPWNRRLRRGWHEGLLAVCPVVLAGCGVGARAARRWAQVLFREYEPRSVLLTGVAEGVGPHVDIGDLVLGESVYLMAGGRVVARYRADPDLMAIAREVVVEVPFRPVRGRLPQVLEAGVATAERAVGQREWGEQLARDHGILAVEMEGAAIAEVCQKHGVPLLVVRAVSDVIGSRWQFLTMISHLVPAQRNAERLVYAIVQHLTSEA